MCVRLEINVQINSGFGAGEVAESLRQQSCPESWPCRTSANKSWSGRCSRTFQRRAVASVVTLPLPITSMCAGTVTFMVAVKRSMPYRGDRKPVAGIEQIAGVVVDRRQLQPGDRRIVGGIEHALVFKRQRGGLVLRHLAFERHTHAGVLRSPVRGQRLAGGVGDLGQAQVVVQLEGGNVQVFERGDFDLGPGRDLVVVRAETASI